MQKNGAVVHSPRLPSQLASSYDLPGTQRAEVGSEEMTVFDPYSPTLDSDPFGVYSALREEHPCFWSEQAGMWVLIELRNPNGVLAK